jgi:hypothetical protein
MKSAITCALVLTAFVPFGCVSGPLVPQVTSASNVYSANTRLPADLRRVAVLPVTCDGGFEASAGRDALQPVLVAELTKTRAFEVVPVSREQLGAVTGKSEWSADEVLPSDFFTRLRACTGCDAVLFCRLKQFRAYPPLAVGWDLKLVDASRRTVLWAVDEIFDSGKPAVANAAKRYYTQAVGRTETIVDPEVFLMSPRLFGQYSAAASLAALLAR